MAITPQLQWSLDRTTQNGLSVAKGIFMAATRDDVQVLALATCRKFGATLPMTTKTCDIVQKTVLPTPSHPVIRFLHAFVGYYKDDSASALGENMAGVHFLGLACALATTIPEFEGATALLAMLRSTTPERELLPTIPQLKQLLASLHSRCSRSGFADSVVRYQVDIGHALFTPRGDYSEYGQKPNMAPSPESLKLLVDAFREVGRLGEATTICAEVKVGTCAPWIAAFTEWCLGAPSIYLEDEERVRTAIVEYVGSKISIVIPKVVDDSGLQLKIIIMREISGPEELITYSKGQEWIGMVGIGAYGKWLLHEYDFDRGLGLRALHKALPHAITMVLSQLSFSESVEAQQYLAGDDPILDLCPRPFPDRKFIANIYNQMLDTEIGAKDIRSRGDGLLIADLDVTKEYLVDLQRDCACETCRSSNPTIDTSSFLTSCKMGIFYDGIATIVTDILTLSLFHLPEKLLVKINRCRFGQKRRGFGSNVTAILRWGLFSPCSTREILTSARVLVGHQDLDKELDDYNQSQPENHTQSDWILTCYKGQAIYPAVFDSSYHFDNMKGYLQLYWLPGILQYGGERWKGVTGGQTTWGPDQPHKISHEESLSPRNLFRHLRTEWAVSTKDNSILEAKLLLKDGERISQTARNPIDSLLGLQYGLVAECSHDRYAKLKNPDRFCVYVGPEALPRFREPGSVVIVPVDGSDDLRFFSIPGAEEERKFVLRKNACLSCSLTFCRKFDAAVLIL
ncbi:uncharacterized protein PAC_16772 [Phialocephala subalpina]|uniref:Uncharacterized protein n=1 Tax=Phialocephala subalpina TaxID=576137 RepID=A0A1L7XP91_9HELO|nr:uncharacterized protein PAC_16772 [Phialocephala subalpina]